MYIYKCVGSVGREGGRGRRPPAREASVPAPQGPRKVGARSAPGFLVAQIRKFSTPRVTSDGFKIFL